MYCVFTGPFHVRTAVGFYSSLRQVNFSTDFAKDNSINRLTSDLSLTIISDRRVTLLNAEVTMAKDTKERILMGSSFTKKEKANPIPSRISHEANVSFVEA